MTLLVAPGRARLRSFRALSTLLLAVSLASSTIGCGHGEDEWQAKLKEIEELNNKLKKTSDDKKKCEDDLAKATDDIAGFKNEIAQLTGAQGNSTSLVGTPEQVVESLLEYHDLGITKFLFRGFDPLEDAIDYGRNLLPLLRARVAERGSRPASPVARAS